MLTEQAILLLQQQLHASHSALMEAYVKTSGPTAPLLRDAVNQSASLYNTLSQIQQNFRVKI